MIRVLHSVSNMDRAGIETMLMNYYKHIDRTKVQFDFLCNKIKPGAYDKEIENLGGHIFHTPGLNPFKYLKYLNYMKELFKQHPEYKIVEAHNGALGVYALYAAKVNNIPIRILHAHGASITKDWKLPIKLFCKTRIPSNANKYFTCGDAAAKCYFDDKIFSNHEYRFVPNAIEVERFAFNKETRNNIRKKFNLEDKHIVGHVGRFMSQKNHSFLIDIFAELVKLDSKTHLVLLGDGELMDSIKQKVDKLGISQSVSFIGNVGNANEWYQAFDVFVLPSIWEGLPVVGVEAQAADLSCFFSDSITKEITLLPKTKFISLNESAKKWALEIREAFNEKKRNNNEQVITEKGYNIKNEALKLQECYLKMGGGLE